MKNFRSLATNRLAETLAEPLKVSQQICEGCCQSVFEEKTLQELQETEAWHFFSNTQ